MQKRGTVQILKFSIKDFFSKCDQICMKKSLIKNVIILCSVEKDDHFRESRRRGYGQQQQILIISYISDVKYDLMRFIY